MALRKLNPGFRNYFRPCVVIAIWSICFGSFVLDKSLLKLFLSGDEGSSKTNPSGRSKTESESESARSIMNLNGDTPSIDNPVWANATDEAEAVYLLANGAWLPPNTEFSMLNDEEFDYLIWAKEQNANMTVKQATEWVPYDLWWGNKNTSLYGTADTLAKYHKNPEVFCRPSWGFYLCDSVRHSFDFHGKHWSKARGVELIDSFVRLFEDTIKSDNHRNATNNANDSRTTPAMMLMGDSVVVGSFWAGMCSLARSGASFVHPCPPDVPVIKRVNSACFRHPRLNNNGTVATWSVYDSQVFDDAPWRRAIFGCPDDQDDCTSPSPTFQWDVVMPNLGVHYNFKNVTIDKRGTDFKRDVSLLTQSLLDHAGAQLEQEESTPSAKTKTLSIHPTLHMFWGSSPQHFARTKAGVFDTDAGVSPTFTPGQDNPRHNPLAGTNGCSALPPSSAAFRANRHRTDIVWDVLLQQRKNRTGINCDLQNLPIQHDPSHFETKSFLRQDCVSKLLDTCHGGVSHLEIDPFWTDRVDAHPGGHCAGWPAELKQDPTGEKCPKFSTDCTHFCWGPILYQPIWERLEIAVKFHVQRCQS